MRLAPSLCGLLFFGLSAAAADTTQATYDLYYQGARTGTVTVTLTRETAHTYYKAIAKPNWLARLFGQGTIIERGTMSSEDLQPQEYFYHDSGRERHYRYVYDWSHGQVLITTHENESTEPLGDSTLDPAAMAVRLLRDLPSPSPNYSVLSKGLLKVYRFETPVLEPLEVLGQKRLVWKVIRIRGSAEDSRIITWHDPKRGQWMVRTVRMEDGDEKVRLELASLNQSDASDLHPVDQ